MPVTAQKNLALSPAATDLGFGGDVLAQQLRDQEEERKRRLNIGRDPAQYGDGVLGPAALSLFGGVSRG